MCTRYIPPEVAEIERRWHIGRHNPPRWWNAPSTDAFRSPVGPFIRSGGVLTVGRFGLIPSWAKTPTPEHHTYNARMETVASKPSFRDAWARGQRCIVPAQSFDEPCWETGRNVWWRFARADGAPWGLAGLHNTWTDRSTGEVHESFTLLTINANAHPLLNRMHKPERGTDRQPLPLAQQDKRAVVPIEPADVDCWLHAPLEQALELVRLAPVEMFSAGLASP